jgi:hypothetical protein
VGSILDKARGFVRHALLASILQADRAHVQPALPGLTPPLRARLANIVVLVHFQAEKVSSI